MNINKVIGLLVLLCCELCLTIKVPPNWNESARSAVKHESSDQVEIIAPQNVQTLHQAQEIPIEYFQYTAQKPQFATDIAAFYGVKNPEQHYKAYSIKPYTGKDKPVLGVHRLVNEVNTINQPDRVLKTEETKMHIHPISHGYEIFHPYKSEEPELKKIYKDPMLSKIRHDLENSKYRLDAYEQEAGKPNITDDEYVEGLEKTESKLFPRKNIPTSYEIHRPERRPTYYRPPPRYSHRDQVLNQRLKHPWNQDYLKIRPKNYKPLKNHIHNLRQHHATKYDDERNEYPQLPHFENIEEPLEGYDIYEKGKQKYIKLRNNIDESINKAVLQNRPAAFQELELQKHEEEPIDEEDEFIPIKNYAQVRKTETYKHLPRKAALDDAETLEEIMNAPRLREAVKSTKAQTVYSEEGYEDSAYDHAGEQKHASDHEGHGGFLKEHENSGGLYKIPSVLGSYQDGRGSEYIDNIEYGKKWTTKNENNEEEIDSDIYSEDEYDEDISAEIYNDKGPKDANRNKREGQHKSETLDSEDIKINDTTNEQSAQDRMHNQSYIVGEPSSHYEIFDNNTQHEVDKRETTFKIPKGDFNSTFLSASDILKFFQQKLIADKDKITEKYPYYFKSIKTINKDSPLRYAENLKLIPQKSGGGTEFYNSRSMLKCPEVDDDVNPLPDKLKNGEHPTENADSNDEEKEKEFKEKQPRLHGLGDKIDCFKAKYFGENPLDSPFFKEEIIANPEPISPPKIPIFKMMKNLNKENGQESKINNVVDSSMKLADIFVLLKKLRNEQNQLEEFIVKANEKLKASLNSSQGQSINNQIQESKIYTDLLEDISNDSNDFISNLDKPISSLNSNQNTINVTYKSYQNKEEVTKPPPKIRRKRATPFVYEPYKIIRDNQYQDSKKTTMTSNISPLIRQLQSSKVVDRVSRSNRDNRQVKPTNSFGAYVDIGKNDRTTAKENPSIVDVSMDQRRGEPRYEIRPTNHKSEYITVENKRAMSVEDYKTRTSSKPSEESTVNIDRQTSTAAPNRGRRRYTQITTVHPYYDVTSFIPKTDKQNVAASTAIKKTVTTHTPTANYKKEKVNEGSNNSSEESDENFNESNTEPEVRTKLVTSLRPSFRRRKTHTTTTDNSQPNNKDEPERLKLITQFRNYKSTEIPDEIAEVSDSATNKQEKEIDGPKYREKKKKTSKSTLVTDTHKYGQDGDGEDDTRKVVDALLKIKQNMNDYMPSYEKEEEMNHEQYKKGNDTNQEDNRDLDNDSSEDDDDDDDDDDDEFDYDDEDDDVDEDDDEDEKEDKDRDGNGNNDDDNDDEEEEEEEADEDEEENYSKLELTTAEPTTSSLVRTTDTTPPTIHDHVDKQEKEQNEEENYLKLELTTAEATKSSLVRTTDAPQPTIASHLHIISTSAPTHSAKLESKPTYFIRRKIKIHKELPFNQSAPHITQFKQDIKEEEIIKEIPTTLKSKPLKKKELLELYKDDDLAKDINKLSDVEIFSEGIDLDKGPKHGGNYRKATKEDLRLLSMKSQESSTKPPKDAEASQSETKKHVELDNYTPQRMHGGNLKSISDFKRTRNNERSSKLVELTESPVRSMHGGNLNYNTRRRDRRRNEKLIELDDNRDNDNSSQEYDNKSSSHNTRTDRLHGGNYKIAKLVEEKQKKNDDIKVPHPSREARLRNAAVLLNNFVQAVPVLTTTPGYILDPSKRMYYYVD